MSSPLDITTKGRIELWQGAVRISSHTVETEAIQALVSQGVGTYELRFPIKVAVVRALGVLAPSSGDTIAPTVPTNVVATAINAGRVDVSWSPSTDAFGVTGYQVFRNGTPLTTTSGLSYSDTTCQPSTFYSYVIVAFDAAGNNSAASTAGTATTPANAAPVWQTIPAQTLIVGNAYLLTLTSYCTDADLDTLTFSVPSGTLPSGVVLSGNRLQGTPTTAGETPTITVRAADAFHQIDTTIAFHTYTADATAPPVPTGLAATVISSSRIDLTWTASTDAAGSANELVSGTQDYRLYRSTDGVTYSLRTTVTGPTYSDTGLSASTSYWYKIAARDVSLNESAQSTAVSATTSAVASWQLSTGHFTPAQLPSLVIFPRPDTETNTWERNRLAPAGIAWRIPISIRGGAWPFEYTLVTGPSGMSIGQHYGDVDYGILSWSVPVAGTYSISVRVRTQDYTRETGADALGEITINWTLTVAAISDSTKFVFMDGTNGNDANSGAFGSPVRTLAGFNALGSSGKQLFIRSGTYAFNSLSSVLDLTNKAKVFVSYPGESVTIDYGGTWSGTNCYISLVGPGGFMGGIRFYRSPPSLSNGFDYYHVNGSGDRNVCFECTFEAFDGLTAVPTNFSNWGGFMMFALAAMHKYVAAVNCLFKDFQHLSSGGATIWYSTKYWLIEGCQITGFLNARNVQQGFISKGHCSEGTIRNCTVPSQSISTAPFFQPQGSDGNLGDNPNNNETCWSYGVNAPPGNNGQNGSANIYGSASYSAWTGYLYRNTLVGGNYLAASASFPSTLYMRENVLCTEHGIPNDATFYGAQPGLTLVNTNNAVSTYANRNNVVVSATGYLLDAYLTANGLTRGTRGHQVF